MIHLLNDYNQCIRASASLNVHLITDQHYSRPISCLPLATTLLDYLSLPLVLPDCRRAPGFIALPGRAHACPLPGARPKRRRG